MSVQENQSHMEMPAEGGSYVRQPDGTLLAVHRSAIQETAEHMEEVSHVAD